MVHEGRADDGLDVDLKWTSSGSTTGPGAWSLEYHDDIGEQEGVDVNRGRWIPAD